MNCNVIICNNQIASSVLECFEKGIAVAASRHIHNILTIGTYDNIDNDPKSLTANYSYHGTAISITQHLDVGYEGVKRFVDIFFQNGIK